MFRLLGAAPGPDIGLPARQPLDRRRRAGARPARQLVDAYLRHEQVPGRYRMHDLVRLYAAEMPPTRTTCRRAPSCCAGARPLPAHRVRGALLPTPREPIPLADSLGSTSPQPLTE